MIKDDDNKDQDKNNKLPERAPWTSHSQYIDMGQDTSKTGRYR